MKRYGAVLLFLTACSLFAGTAENGRIIAEIDGVPLKAGDLAPEVRAVLATSSSSPDVYDISLKAAVAMELKLRTTLALLKQCGISVNRATAEKYMVDRCKLYPESGKFLRQGMEKQLDDRKFQLKCAIYYYVLSRFPEAAQVTSEETNSFYYANRHLFRRTTAPEYLVLRVSGNTPGAEKKAQDIRLALLQGQNISSVAAAEKLTPEKADAAIVLILSEFKLKKHSVSPVFQSGNDWLAAICIRESERSFAPLKNIEAFVAEELLSRRCGAAFDRVLKQEISRKNIKYRR